MLPLKLVTFERHMLADDRPTHPMTFTIRLKFSGECDRHAMQRAVRVAVERHPLLAAHLTGDTPSQYTWVDAPDALPYLDFGPLDAPLRFPGQEQIGLRTSTGLRIWVRGDEERTEMRLQFHHSCCDGIGAYRFIEDLLCAYDTESRPAAGTESFRPLEPERLRERGKLGLAWWHVLLRLPLEIWGVVGGLFTFFAIRPQQLFTPEKPAADTLDKLALLDYPAYEFNRRESDRFRELARDAKATINDLLLRELFVALYAWNARHDPKLRKGVLRISMPVSLRSADDETMPAANVVAIVYADRRMNWFRNLQFLLLTVRLETAFLKNLGLAVSFVRSCALLNAIPGGNKLMYHAQRCYATSLLSNMGRLFTTARLPRDDDKLVAGGLTLQGVESAPPIRPFTPAVFTALSYAGRLTLVMNYDRYHFTPETAQELMDDIVAHIRETCRTEDVPSEPVPVLVAHR